MSEFKFFSEYIAPWALPKEDLPIHMIWKDEFNWDKIVVHIPPELVINEFYNVSKYEKEMFYEILELKTPNFFGFVVSTKDITNEMYERFEIIVHFIEQGMIKYEKIFFANVFRPILSLKEDPKPVYLEDKRKQVLDIQLLLSGFGKISMNVELLVGGKFVPRAGQLYEEIVRRIMTTFSDENEVTEDKKIRIDTQYLTDKTKEYIEDIENGIIPEEIDKAVIEEFYEWLKSGNNKDKISKLITQQLETLLIDSILYYLDRNPATDVEMPQGKPVLFIEKATHGVSVRFRYNDGMENEYKPLMIEVVINDKRKDKTKSLELPINIKWNYNEINPLGICEKNGR